MTRAVGLVLTAALALALTGCGRKDTPHPPDNAYYPQKYPALILPAQAGVASEPLAATEYREMLQTQQRDAATKAPALPPLPTAPPPAPSFQDLHHPEADNPPGGASQ